MSVKNKVNYGKNNQIISSSEIQLSQIVGDILEKYTCEFVSPIKESFSEKRKIINDAKDMSTKEKLEAYETAEDKYIKDIVRYMLIVSVTVGLPFVLKNKNAINELQKHWEDNMMIS